MTTPAEQFWAELQREEERRREECKARTFRQIEEKVTREVRQIIRARDLNAAEQQEDDK